MTLEEHKIWKKFQKVYIQKKKIIIKKISSYLYKIDGEKKIFFLLKIV